MPTARCPVPGAHEHTTVLLPRRAWAAFSTRPSRRIPASMIRRPSVMAATSPDMAGVQTAC